MAADHEKKLAQARKTLEAEAERIQRRTEAEVADLRATISRLEVDVMKVSGINDRSWGCTETMKADDG